MFNAICKPLLFLLFLTRVSPAPETDPLHRIKHVVLLVMENRSFDHLLGYVNNPPGMDGLIGKKYFNHLDPTNVKSPRVYTSKGAAWSSQQDPGHGVSSVTTQLYGKPAAINNVQRFPNGTADYPTPNMGGFLSDAFYIYERNQDDAEEVMTAFDPQDIPITAQLAREFAVSDRWFASVAGPTQPNRAYIHSATSHGEIENHKARMVGGYPQKTIYQAMVESGQDFKVYFNDAPSSLLYKWMRNPAVVAKHIRPYKPTLGGKGIFSGFVKDCREGKLSGLTLIEPRYFDSKPKFGQAVKHANDDHPPHDLRRGQNLIKEVYEAVRNSPNWEETLLLITYDEHGGYYDHVPPPVKGVPNPDGLTGDGNDFDRLGVRVPTLFISPWIKKGSILHEPRGPTATSHYEHSSISATLKRVFKWNDFLTRRDAWASPFDHLWTDNQFSTNSPRQDCPKTLLDAMEIDGQVEEIATSDLTPGEFNVLRKREVMLDEQGKPIVQNLDASKADGSPLTDMQEALVSIAAGLTNTTLPEDIEMMGKPQARDFVMENFSKWMAEHAKDMKQEFEQ